MSLQEKYASLFAHLPESSLIDHTFFDIGGYGYYENISSNILAFYLNNRSRYHSFGEPMLKALLKASHLESFITDPMPAVTIQRELTTDSGRIDLVISTADWVLAIENKIRHRVHNGLVEYSNYIDKRFPEKLREKIVLSVKDETGSMEGGFENLTYDRLITEIDIALSEHNWTVSDKYSLYLYEFLQTFRNMYQPIKMEKEEIDFLILNRDKISELLGLEGRFEKYVKQRCEKIHDRIKVTNGISKWVYDGYDIGFHYTCGGFQYKLECLLDKHGIEIVLCVEKNHVDLGAIQNLKLSERLDFNNIRYAIENTRVVIEDNIDFQTDDEIIIQKLQSYVDELRPIS